MEVGIIVKMEDKKTGEPVNVMFDSKSRSIIRYDGGEKVTTDDFSNEDWDKISKVVDSVKKEIKSDQSLVELLSKSLSTDKNADKKVLRVDS